MAATHLEVKFFVDKDTNTLIFAEAGGDFVDVLYSFLTLPLGTIVRLIGKTWLKPASTLGCFASLYQSLTSLDNEYFRAEGFKDMLLRPRSSSEVMCRKLKINIDDTEAEYFLCDCFSSNMSIYKKTKCTECLYMGKRKVIGNSSSSKENVFVTKASKFIITDDLKVIPAVIGTIAGFLDNLGIQDMNALEGTTVKLGRNEVIELLKLTFFSPTPLKDLFVSKTKQHVNNYLPKTLSLYKSESVDLSGKDRKINVKVVLRKSTKELLFVEAGHDFLDLLFSFLLIPLGEMLHLMEGQSSGFGCIHWLYKSALSLDPQYFISKDVKNNLLRPKLPPVPVLEYGRNLLLPLKTTELICSIDGATRTMRTCISLYGVDRFGGFVRDDKTFMVFDNLALTPFSAESIISMCKRNELSLSDLEEIPLSLGMGRGYKHSESFS